MRWTSVLIFLCVFLWVCTSVWATHFLLDLHLAIGMAKVVQCRFPLADATWMSWVAVFLLIHWSLGSLHQCFPDERSPLWCYVNISCAFGLSLKTQSHGTSCVNATLNMQLHWVLHASFYYSSCASRPSMLHRTLGPKGGFISADWTNRYFAPTLDDFQHDWRFGQCKPCFTVIVPSFIPFLAKDICPFAVAGTVSRGKSKNHYVFSVFSFNPPFGTSSTLFGSLYRSPTSWQTVLTCACI